MITREMVLALGVSALAFGCSEQPSETQEIIDNLVEAGFPADDIMVVDGVVYTGRDAVVTLQASREFLEVDPSSSQEHYRASNLVSASVRTICINGAAFTGTLSTGLNMAIANYNALGLTFQMQRTTGSTSGCNAAITARVISGTGSSAGFASGGLPYPEINIGSGTVQYGLDVIEHLITHELGHTMGFRHTDYFNRSISCGTGGNEGDGGVGAIHIPNTPTGATVGGSVMNSCSRSNETGEFTAPDIAGLQELYR